MYKEEKNSQNNQNNNNNADPLKETAEEDLKVINEEEFSNKLKLTKNNFSSPSTKETNGSSNNNNVNSAFSQQNGNNCNQKISLSNKRSFTPTKKEPKKTDGNSSSSKGVFNLNTGQSNNNVVVNKFSSGRSIGSSVNKNVLNRKTIVCDKNLIDPSLNGINLNSALKKK